MIRLSRRLREKLSYSARFLRFRFASPRLYTIAALSLEQRLLPLIQSFPLGFELF